MQKISAALFLAATAVLASESNIQVVQMTCRDLGYTDCAGEHAECIKGISNNPAGCCPSGASCGATEGVAPAAPVASTSSSSLPANPVNLATATVPTAEIFKTEVLPGEGDENLHLDSEKTLKTSPSSAETAGVEMEGGQGEDGSEDRDGGIDTQGSNNDNPNGKDTFMKDEKSDTDAKVKGTDDDKNSVIGLLKADNTTDLSAETVSIDGSDAESKLTLDSDTKKDGDDKDENKGEGKGEDDKDATASSASDTTLATSLSVPLPTGASSENKEGPVQVAGAAGFGASMISVVGAIAGAVLLI